MAVTHYVPTPNPNPTMWMERVSVCGVTCRTGARDGYANGSSNVVNADCPECLGKSKQVEMFK